MKLTIIRHGITEGNARKLFYGAADIPLLPEGEAELRRLSAEHPYPTASYYYTSPLYRTQQTLRILYGDVPFTVVDDLREFNFGDFEMRELKGDLDHDEAFLAWFSTGMKDTCPGGDNMADFTVRVADAMAPIIARGEDAVCVIHGAVIAALLSVWFPIEEGIFQRAPHPGTGYQVIFENGQPVSYHAIP